MPRFKQHVLGVVKDPPFVSIALVASGGISDLQKYDASSGSYDPDYTITPLTIEPSIAVVDNSTPFGAVNARTLLTNIHWYEIGPSGNTEITFNGSTPSIPGYATLDNTEGSATAGRLQVAKNAAPGAPIQLLFKAVLVVGPDSYKIERTFSVKCRDNTPSVRCKFDAPGGEFYNPIHDADDLKIRLDVWENDKPCPAANFIPVWEVFRDDNSWSEYGSDVTDYWLDIATDKMSAVLHRPLMGDEASIRVRLRYDADGNPSSVTLSPTSIVPSCTFNTHRTYGNYQTRLEGVTNTLADWVKEVRPKVVFKDGKGDIQNPSKYFAIDFYARKADGSAITAADFVGSASESSDGWGLELLMSTAKADGGALNIVYDTDCEIGPLKALVDAADGKVLADADGAIILARFRQTS